MKKLLAVFMVFILLFGICLSAGCVDQKKAQEEAKAAAAKAKALEEQRLAQEAAARAKALEEQKKAEEAAARAREEAIIRAMGPVARGKGVPEAFSYTPSRKIHPLVLINISGSAHDWTAKIPQEWRPKSIGETQLVAVITKGSKSLQTCAYYQGPPVTRYQYYLKVELKEAKTARMISSTTLYGSTPISCRQRESYWLTSLYGSEVTFDQVKAWLQGYVVP